MHSNNVSHSVATKRSHYLAVVTEAEAGVGVEAAGWELIDALFCGLTIRLRETRTWSDRNAFLDCVVEAVVVVVAAAAAVALGSVHTGMLVWCNWISFVRFRLPFLTWHFHFEQKKKHKKKKKKKKKKKHKKGKSKRHRRSRSRSRSRCFYAMQWLLLFSLSGFCYPRCFFEWFSFLHNLNGFEVSL